MVNGKDYKGSHPLSFAFIKLFFMSMEVILPLLIFLIVVIVILGQIVTLIEKWTLFNGLYWTFVTALTIGYGDIRPLKKVSKTLSILIGFIGIMLTGIVVAVTINTTQVVLEKYANKSVIEHIKQEFN